MENKKLHISVSTILLIIAIGVIIVMAFMLYKLSNSKTKAETEIQQLKADNQNMQTTLNNIQNSLNKVTSTKNNESSGVATKSDNNTVTNTSKTEEDQVKDVANAFVKAVNEKDWATVEKYSSEQIVSELKKYNVSNMSLDLNTLEKNPNNTNGYYCYDSYDIDYNGLNIKDLSLGRLFCIDNENGTFVVSTCYATGL